MKATLMFSNTMPRGYRHQAKAQGCQLGYPQLLRLAGRALHDRPRIQVMGDGGRPGQGQA